MSEDTSETNFTVFWFFFSFPFGWIIIYSPAVYTSASAVGCFVEMRDTIEMKEELVCDPICRNWIQLLNTRFTPRAKDIVCKMTMPPVVGGARLCIHTIKKLYYYIGYRGKKTAVNIYREESIRWPWTTYMRLWWRCASGCSCRPVSLAQTFHLTNEFRLKTNPLIPLKMLGTYFDYFRLFSAFVISFDFLKIVWEIARKEIVFRLPLLPTIFHRLKAANVLWLSVRIPPPPTRTIKYSLGRRGNKKWSVQKFERYTVPCRRRVRAERAHHL